MDQNFWHSFNGYVIHIGYHVQNTHYKTHKQHVDSTWKWSSLETDRCKPPFFFWGMETANLPFSFHKQKPQLKQRGKNSRGRKKIVIQGRSFRCVAQEAASIHKLSKPVVFCNDCFFQQYSLRCYSQHSNFLSHPCKLPCALPLSLSLSLSLSPSSHSTYVLFAEK